MSYGFVDIKTYDGELIKASFGIEIIPWTYYVQSTEKGRMTYRFNGLESKKRLVDFLKNTTKWEGMDVKF